MPSNEAIRFEVHKRLLAVDAANIELMKYVSLDLVGSDQWSDSLASFWGAVSELKSFLNEYGQPRLI
jgi:hypothetical protein